MISLKNSSQSWIKIQRSFSLVTVEPNKFLRPSRVKILKRDLRKIISADKILWTYSNNTKNQLKTTLMKTKDGQEIFMLCQKLLLNFIHMFWVDIMMSLTETFKFTHAAQVQSKLTWTKKVKKLFKKESRLHYTWLSYHLKLTKKNKDISLKIKRKHRSLNKLCDEHHKNWHMIFIAIPIYTPYSFIIIKNIRL